MSVKTVVYIDDVDVSSYVKGWNIDKTADQEISQISVKIIKTANTLVTIDNGSTLRVYRGETTGLEYYVFRGKIDKINKNKALWTLQGKDRLDELKKAEITKSFDAATDTYAGVGSELFIDIVTAGGLSADATSVVSTGVESTKLLGEFVCNHRDNYEACEEIVDTYDYQMFYKPDTDLVYAQPKGYTNNTTVLVVGTNVFNSPNWEKDNLRNVNIVTVVGAERELEFTESFTTGGTTYTLSKTPQSVKVYVDDVLQTGGVQDSTQNYDYYVDAEKKQIIFLTTQTGTVEIRYSYKVPAPIKVSDKDSKDSYGESNKTYFKSGWQTVSDAKVYAKRELKRQKDESVSTSLKVNNALNLEPGQSVQVIDTVNNEDRTIRINRIKIGWPYKGDEVVVGDITRVTDLDKDTSIRIRRLEEAASKNQDLLNEVFDLIRNLQYKRRYTKKKLNGTDVYVNQGRNLYKEYFYDETFIDSGTATVDTANKQLVF